MQVRGPAYGRRRLPPAHDRQGGGERSGRAAGKMPGEGAKGRGARRRGRPDSPSGGAIHEALSRWREPSGGGAYRAPSTRPLLARIRRMIFQALAGSFTTVADRPRAAFYSVRRGPRHHADHGAECALPGHPNPNLPVAPGGANASPANCRARPETSRGGAASPRKLSNPGASGKR